MFRKCIVGGVPPSFLPRSLHGEEARKYALLLTDALSAAFRILRCSLSLHRRRVVAERTVSELVDHNQATFGVPLASLPHQFSNTYFSRLRALGPRVEAAAKARWGPSALDHVTKTLDASPEATAVVIGTIYKEMKGKPNMMEEATRDVLEQRPETVDGAKYCSDDDQLLLEDDSGRLTLQLPASLADANLVTGVVVCVRGQLTESGELVVQDMCLPGLAPQRALRARATSSERYIALVSGLHIGRSSQDMLPLQMLAEHLSGQLGCDEDHRLQANIVRLIIAGNAAGNPAAAMVDASDGVWQPSDALKKMKPTDQKALAQTVRTLDQFLTSVSAAMPVDLMPGSDDPCNFMLPQQPFHPCMLPQSSQLATLNLCTNPYCCDVDGVRIVGTSGQPLDDMQRYLPADDRLGTLAHSLQFQHLAPTAPDTLGCYPFASTDPFVLDECPHLYFAGNQPRFGTTEITGSEGQRVRVVLVPDFEKEHTCVLVSLDTLECRPISFSGLGTDAMAITS